ncbi:MAG: O-antigen ligase family protein [Gemmatimonadaceae bacterium]
MRFPVAHAPSGWSHGEPRPSRGGFGWGGNVVLVAGAALVFALALLPGAGQVVLVGYLPATVALGIALLRYDPPLYTAYVWWLWFLTPLVRRLVDYQVGWNPTNPMLVAPFLVTGLTAVTLIRHFPKLRRAALFPFVLPLAGITYGYVVGLARAGFLAATYSLLIWVTPIVFGFYLALQGREYPAHRRAVERTFLAGVVILGVYGVYQFINPPPWDRFWMINSRMDSIGLPEPFRIRVFGTMNSPGPLAVILMGGVLLLFSTRSPFRWLAAVPAYAAFLLSSVRSAWVGWLIAVLVYAWYLPVRFRARLGLAMAVLGVLLLPLLSFGPVNAVVTARLRSFSALGEDNSFQARSTLYAGLADKALRNIAGRGLGATGAGVKLSQAPGVRDQDSGILDIFYSLGWLGGALFSAGVGLIVLRSLRRVGDADDHFAVALRGVGVAMCAMMVSFNSMAGNAGVLFWGFLGLHLAAEHYHAGEGAADDG